MFSEEDTKEIFRLFPPRNSAEFLPSLILSSGGHGFVTLEFVQARFRSRVTKGGPLYHHPNTLLDADGSNIITTGERDALQQKMKDLLWRTIVSKPTFARDNDLSTQSVDVLLGTIEGQLVEIDEYHVCSESYKSQVSHSISDQLKQSLDEVQSVDVVFTELPGSPPEWFTLRILEEVLSSQNLVDKFHVQGRSDRFQCAPMQITQHKRDAVLEDLQHGKRAYIDLEAFWKEFSELFFTVDDARQHVENIVDVEIVSSFAVSSAWISRCLKECVQILQLNGCIDLAVSLLDPPNSSVRTDDSEKQQGSSDFPRSLQHHMEQRFGESIVAVLQHDTGIQTHRAGDFILTSTAYNNERHTLLDYAEAAAIAQWQELKDDPAKEVKYSSFSVTSKIPDEQPISNALIKTKPVEKGVEEHFWSTISTQEHQNEAQFFDFWTDRVITRCHIYNEGLSSIEDQKLRDQLAELFASYARKELLPDSIAKARAQGLALSRKTRKNISKLETILKANKLETLGILSALEKFNKKQGISAPNNASLEAAKKVMVSDMVRRMQKQKQSDGPVLFLTLVLVLFANHYNGVLYATGKFAPKLLKQLKTVLAVEQYEKVERWKEDAKTSSLSAEDRAEMKTMAEA